MTIEKFALPSASVVQCRDKRRWILQCRLFREPIAQHSVRNKKAPSVRRGLMLNQQVQLTGWLGGWLRHQARGQGRYQGRHQRRQA